MSGFDSIEYEVADGRARITLNRPEKLNALSLKLQSELNEALWEADNDTAVHCVILRGAGRAFSAGYDLTGADGNVPVSRVQSDDNQYRGGRGIDDDAWQLERAQRYRMALFDMHKPSIAQVHGYCLAGGTDVALLCDMVICAEDALFGFPPARRSRCAAEQHVALQRRPAVGQAVDAHRRLHHRRRGAADRLGAESGAEGASRIRGRAVGGPSVPDRPRPALHQQAHHQHGLGADGRSHLAAHGGRERRARPQRQGGRSGSASLSPRLVCAKRCATATASSATVACA